MFEPYRPEPYSDFADPANRAAYERALATVEGTLGAHHAMVIGGTEVDGDDHFESVDPGRPDRIVGTATAATVEHADAAIGAAWAAFPAWAALSAESRAKAVVKVAEVMRRRTYELAALQTFEAGKNYAEAEADVAEAIDFLVYYAHRALEMDDPVPVLSRPGEVNESFLRPLGAGVVIPPWNFPLAILAGMAMGPVVAGNTVVIKPASATPVVGAAFMSILAETGFPAGVVNFLPGAGGVVGDALVDHPRTRFVNFTGSKEVGLRIAEHASVVHPGQVWLKRAYMEMGGKDALIVDETADLEAAASAAVTSAYGFQGQKCSACSRLIAVDSVHDELLDLVVDKVSALEVGPAQENLAVGPVITAAQHRSILEEIDGGRAQGKLVLGGNPIDRDGGYYIEPTIFADVAPDSRLAQHEIFGPVLSVIRAADFDEAVSIFNGTEFGLTGGLFSRDRARLERAKRELHVGNLYLNRKITGAFVGVQPFGGFNMSGSNAKAGGPDYLRLFMEMKTVAEQL
jgi:1-pyrroline-5-carboxylate dehydrogenase